MAKKEDVLAEIHRLMNEPIKRARRKARRSKGAVDDRLRAEGIAQLLERMSRNGNGEIS